MIRIVFLLVRLSSVIRLIWKYILFVILIIYIVISVLNVLNGSVSMIDSGSD